MFYPNTRWAQTANYGYTPNELLQRVFLAVSVDLVDFDSPFWGLVLHLFRIILVCISFKQAPETISPINFHSIQSVIILKLNGTVSDFTNGVFI